MPLDPSIPLQVKPLNLEQPDPIERYTKLAGLEANQIALQKARQGQADDAATREAFKGGGGTDEIFNRLVAAGQPQAAMAYRKQIEESAGRQATTGLHTAQAGKANWEVQKELAGHGANLLGKANADNWEDIVRAGELAKYWTPEAAQQMRQQGFSPEFVARAQASSLTYQRQLEADNRAGTLTQTTRSNDLKAANEPFVPGPGGVPVAQPAVQAFQTGKAKAGATNVSVSTEKKYGEQFAGEVAKGDVALRDAASKAPELADRANRVRAAIASGKVITGAGADVRLAIGKALNVAGASDAEVISNTETLSTSLAQNTLDAIKGSGLGSGSGFSNADRDFLEKAAGGKITLEGRTISRLAELAHRAATRSAEAWSTRVKQIPASAIGGTGISTDPVTVAPLVPDASQYTHEEIDAELRRRKVIR